MKNCLLVLRKIVNPSKEGFLNFFYFIRDDSFSYYFLF